MRWMLESAVLVVLSVSTCALPPAAGQTRPTPAEPPKRIAVVGDELVAGPTSHGLGFVDHLRVLLTAGAPGEFELYGFGVPGTTVLQTTPNTYWGTDAFEQSLALKPDVVIISFGINDARAPEFELGSSFFEKHMRRMIERFMGVNANARVILTSVPPLLGADVANTDLGARYVEMDEAVDSLARGYGLDMIDFTSPLLEHPEFMPDGVRPHSRGQELLAAQAFEVLTGRPAPVSAPMPRGYSIPLVDLNDDDRFIVVDREKGQYLGHVSTCMLADGRTILAVYPKGHGRGAIVYKRSDDGGQTWSDRLPTPASWATSKETPTIHRTIDPRDGAERLILWSGLYPARLSVSEDDGATWSELGPAGDWGGIVVMGFVERLRDGSYLAMFHDDGRFFRESGRRDDPVVFTLFQTFSHDGGLTWSEPEAVWSGSEMQLCEPGVIRSPDGATLAVLLRENSRRHNSHVIFSTDEGETWSEPRELPAALTGDRHTARYAPDGRLFVCFRDTTLDSPTQGDWAGWVGTWDDIVQGREGQYRVRIKDNLERWDSTYPGVEVLPDGTFVVTTYGHWDADEEPYILSARFTLDELDARVPGGE